MRTLSVIAAAVIAATAHAQDSAQTNMNYANRYDQHVAGVYDKREADWRNGALVYQVLVDRFAPSANLDAKRSLYPAPKKLREWKEEPRKGTYLEKENVWSHEIDFWGGDLASTMSKLDYVQQLGADVLYLNPVVLDGVSNHMGRNSPKFKEAKANAKSPYRDWFVFGRDYKGGTRTWWNAQNLPELNLENKAVSDHLWAAKDSVVRSDSKLMDGDNLIDQLSGKVLKLQGSMVETKLPPQTALILKPKLMTPDGYSNYKRAQ